jgi:signal transduction histidine kinase
LLVDDEVRNLVALEAILEEPDYRLHRALNADEALRLLLQRDVAAIVLDIKMPGVSGLELAQMIKDRKRSRETPLVFLTAHMVDDHHVIAGYGAGAVDYLTKPVNPAVLRQKIAVFADLFRKTRELAELNETLEARVKERTAELERSEAMLRAAAIQKDEFLAILAHELRNPLAPLRIGLDTMRREQEDTPRVTRALASMNRQLDHMVHLVDDLLDVSRISRGTLLLKRELVGLDLIVRTAVETALPFFEHKNQKLTLEIGADVCALADPTRIAQIVTNLLHNAAKFTPEGGEIRAELTKQGDSAVIRVRDSGEGIPGDQIDRVFEMFTRVSRPGSSPEGGLGIGLAIARRLAEMHGGSLGASSEGEGRGTTVTLTLPLAPADENGRSRRVGPETNQEKSHPLNVLVIEDNEDVADTLFDWLESTGHRVSLARSGEIGVDLARQTRPNVVLCDLGLPGMDGFEVCKSIRAIGPEVHPVMIALSGFGQTKDLASAREAGFDDHLIKPVAPELLEALLRRVE